MGENRQYQKQPVILKKNPGILKGDIQKIHIIFFNILLLFDYKFSLTFYVYRLKITFNSFIISYIIQIL